MKKLILLLVLLTTASFGADYHSPYDPGAARSDLNNVTPATGRAALELGTMAVATATDYVATSSLAARVDTINASFTGDIDVAGDVGAATVNGVAPLTAAEKTQALVGGYFVSATQAASQTFTTGGYAVASFAAELSDISGSFAASAYTAVASGVYNVTVSIEIANPATEGHGIALKLYKNGVAIAPIIGYCLRAGTTTTTQKTFAISVLLTAGDTIDIRAVAVGTNTNTSSTNVVNWIQVSRMGAV